jgi:hypothetical protein
LGWPAGKSGAVLKISKAARIIHKNDFPIGAAAALNEGFPTGFRSPGAGPPLGVEELRRRKRC